MSIIEKAIEKLNAEQAGKQDGLADNVDRPLDPARDPQASGQAPMEPRDGGAAPTFEQPQESPAVKPNGKVIDLPLDRLKLLGMVTPDDPRSRIAEENRIIKRPLLMNIAGKGATTVDNPNLIMVTSAQPGEGKTFTALNLAISIAMEQDKTVLFVDADVAKASAAALLGIPDDYPGLIDLLMDNGTKISDVLLHTTIPNLRVLPAGHAHERSTELLASAGMQRLMAELAQRYPDRVIIFDSPPILFTTEAGVLASLMGQIVFVVAETQTPQGKVVEALSHLGSEKIIGLLLNKSTNRGNGTDGYGFGYGYGYGYGYNRDRKNN
jgi:exopolysaccharide/PEP-CTERM locus tyrosine autokinase